MSWLTCGHPHTHSLSSGSGCPHAEHRGLKDHPPATATSPLGSPLAPLSIGIPLRPHPHPVVRGRDKAGRVDPHRPVYGWPVVVPHPELVPHRPAHIPSQSSL